MDTLRWWKKLIGYKYVTYEFEGDCYGEFYVNSAITCDIEDIKIPNPDTYFKSSVINWGFTPKFIKYSKDMPKRYYKDHVYYTKNPKPNR